MPRHQASLKRYETGVQVAGQWRGRAEANTESILAAGELPSAQLPLRLTSNEITSSKWLLLTIPTVATDVWRRGRYLE